MSHEKRQSLSVDEYVAGVRAGDRTVLARAITLIESTRADHRAQARAVLDALFLHAGSAHRIGITGVPGVGKSTFIERWGNELTDRGRKVAVLAVDPTSTLTGGSILGDKTRMQQLASNPNAFIRPSPTSGTLGGVAKRTRETILLVEAAGFDTVLVETVGVGQSEALVADIVDTFLLLMLPGAGDDLQGIKRGVLELADVIAINKADGAMLESAKLAQHQYKTAIDILRGRTPEWVPPVLTISALAGDGLGELTGEVERHKAEQTQSGAFETRRREQLTRWMWALIERDLLGAFREHPRVRAQLDAVEREVRDRKRTPLAAAHDLLEIFSA